MNLDDYKFKSFRNEFHEKYLTANHFCGLVVKTGQPIYGKSGIAKCTKNGMTYYTRYFDVGLNLWEFDMFSDLKLASGEIVKVYQGSKRKLIEVDTHSSAENLEII